MEVSFDQGFVFLGGGLDDSTGVAILAAITFDKEMQLVSSCQVGPSDMNCVYSMRRLKEGNILFCGGYRSIAVMLFDEINKAFYTMCNVEGVMQDQISDLRFFEGSLFCISPA